MKVKMICLTVLFAFASVALPAQENKTPRTREVGINFGSLNSFGISYKKGSDHRLLRISLLTADAGTSSDWGKPEDSTDYKTQNYGAGIRMGFETHLPVAGSFDFIWGLEGGLDFSYHKQKQETKNFSSSFEGWGITPSVSLILGASYTFKEHFVVGAEITPGVVYTYGKSTAIGNTVSQKITTSSFSFGFSNNAASIYLAYRFKK